MKKMTHFQENSSPANNDFREDEFIPGEVISAGDDFARDEFISGEVIPGQKLTSQNMDSSRRKSSLARDDFARDEFISGEVIFSQR